MAAKKKTKKRPAETGRRRANPTPNVVGGIALPTPYHATRLVRQYAELLSTPDDLRTFLGLLARLADRYGILTLREAADLLRADDPDFDEQVFLAFARIAAHDRPGERDFVILDNETLFGRPVKGAKGRYLCDATVLEYEDPVGAFASLLTCHRQVGGLERLNAPEREEAREAHAKAREALVAHLRGWDLPEARTPEALADTVDAFLRRLQWGTPDSALSLAHALLKDLRPSPDADFDALIRDYFATLPLQSLGGRTFAEGEPLLRAEEDRHDAEIAALIRQAPENGHGLLPDTLSGRGADALYAAIPLPAETVTALTRHLAAFADLYGIIPVQAAHALIERVSPGLVSREDFLAYAAIRRHAPEAEITFDILGEDDVYDDAEATPIENRLIVCSDLVDFYLDTLGQPLLEEQARSASFYLPPTAQELFRYGDFDQAPCYYDDAETLAATRQALDEALLDTQDMPARDDLLDNLVLNVRHGNHRPETLLTTLMRIPGVRLRDAKARDRLLKALRPFSAHARRIALLGHTDAEAGPDAPTP